MSSSSEPLVPVECDLRDYTWMPLDVRRLLTSETWILASADVKVACVTLWCEAWQQVPAASLPDNDRIIAHLSGAGAMWKKIRDEVLRGWVSCSDGRIYHPVVAEKARQAWALKQAQKARTEAARIAKQNRRAATTETPPAARQAAPTMSVTEPVTGAVTIAATGSVTEVATEDVTSSKRKEQNRTDLKEEELPTVVPPARASPLGARLPDDWSPGDVGWQFAVEQGLEPSAVLAQFCDFWRAKPGKDGRKLDWLATWRTWCRNEAKWQATPRRTEPTGKLDIYADLALARGYPQ